MKDWRTVRGTPAAPIGNVIIPASRVYMGVFLVLECAALMRMTDLQLENQWYYATFLSEGPLSSDVSAEIERRKRL